MEQVKELQGEQDAGMRTLTEGNQSSFIWNLTRRRSWGDQIHTPVGGKLPNLVCIGLQFSEILIRWVPMFGGKWSRKNPLNIQQSDLKTLWSRESRLHILPISVDGFSSAASVRDIRAWYNWNGLNV